jgi:hypothetical protein
MTTFKKLKNFPGYSIAENGTMKTPRGKVRRPKKVVVEGSKLTVQTFPEKKGFGNINIKFLR